ncbi:MAG TPA: response regulator transcription factor [Candidatus Saccharimonadales bacterium]|nr:response regulator transcription factor [Candidatus Saccharimonadales bacterium]
MKALTYLVDDDKEFLNYLKNTLLENNYSVKTFTKGSQVLAGIEEQKPDLVILDLVLPDMQGESVCSEIRKHHDDISIIMLTSKNSISEKVEGLNLGADDYITKPFNQDEFLARIKSRLRKFGKSEDVLRVKDLEIDTKKVQVHRAGKEIKLTPHEFKLLEYLIQNKGIVLSRDMILTRVWEYSLDIESRVVDVYMGYLRKKVDNGYKTKLIQSVRGFGYTIND